MKDFDTWKKLHDSGKLSEFNQKDSSGVLWLKIKSILRKDLFSKFLAKSEVCLPNKKLQEQFKAVYQMMQADQQLAQNLDRFIRDESRNILGKINGEKLVSELYKLKFFDWGGDYKNSLDKYLVSQYVKKFMSYDDLICKFESEINRAVQGYVLNSWYNHWSSILIEHLFWTHRDILPAVGQIKNVDFFLHGIPFDLKVTYLPEGYIKAKRKERKWQQEIALLKQEAKKLGIGFNKSGSDSSIYYEITEKMRDKNTTQCQDVLDLLQEQRQQILNDAKHSPKELAGWLYENQGEMRFSSENRLFLILVDSVNYEQSWKLKRNIDLLKPVICEYLDHFDKNKANRLELDFQYKSQSYTVLSDVIFVVK
jgi:hypothetical protein